MSNLNNEVFNENLREQRIEWLAELGVLEEDILVDEKGEYILEEPVLMDDGDEQENGEAIKHYLPDNLQARNFLK